MSFLLVKYRLLRCGTDITKPIGSQVQVAGDAATAGAGAVGAANGEKKRERGPAGGDASRKPKKEDKPKVINNSAAAKKEVGKKPATGAAKGGKGAESKDEKNQLGIQADKATDFPKWYQQVVKRSELIEYYDISGCYILRPLAYSMWESIQTFLNGEIKKLGVKNSYFPLFVSEKALNTEKAHVEGFAAEVAWVTHSGESKLEEAIAVRPTSETIMYPSYAKWIRSHRDLPLKLNQWSNVVRWEFKNPTPFIRSREFLWQEGHTAFATKKEADAEVLDILNLYMRVYEELLAVPVVRGRKTECEKFAGGDYTTTVEAFIPVVGRGIQGATSHGLGQNFAKMFKIEFEDEKGERQKVWQNSWGLTTRTIGVMVMVHGDNTGLVLPPRVAPTQVVVIPILTKDGSAAILERTKLIVKELKARGVRVESDTRDNYRPGWKYADWEMRGVPIRIEIGNKDMEARQCVLARRDYDSKQAGAKTSVPWSNLTASVIALLDEIQNSMLARATAERDARLKQVRTWTEFLGALDIACMALAPHCAGTSCEEQIKQKSGEAAKAQFAEEERLAKLRAAETKANGGEADEEEGAAGEKLTGAAKSLCIPFDQPQLAGGQKCVHCDQPAKHWTLFGRSY